MKCAGMILLALALAGARLGLAGEVDQRKPYGRVCISVIDGSGNEQALDTYRPAARQGNVSLQAHVEANTPCMVVVAAFDAQGGGVLAGWPPQVADLQAWDEVVLPKPSTPSKTALNAPFEVEVLFLASKAPAAGDIRKLVGLMQKPAGNATLTRLQAKKLRELMSGTIAESDRAHYLATRAQTEIGGTIRGLTWEWRKYASEVNFSDERPGLLIFPGGKP